MFTALLCLAAESASTEIVETITNTKTMGALGALVAIYFINQFFRRRSPDCDDMEHEKTKQLILQESGKTTQNLIDTIRVIVLSKEQDKKEKDGDRK